MVRAFYTDIIDLLALDERIIKIMAPVDISFIQLPDYRLVEAYRFRFGPH